MTKTTNTNQPSIHVNGLTPYILALEFWGILVCIYVIMGGV
jgi:hypothetical protein